jgi:gas vesicle protein
MRQHPFHLLQRYWRPFFWVFFICFALAGTLIYQIPKKYEVRSSIEVASSLVADHVEAIEPATQIAKMVIDLYGPSSAIELQERGVPISSLAAVENLKAEATGRHVFLANQVREADVTIAKDFQQNIIEHVIKAGAPLVQTMRLGISAKIESVRRSAQALSDHIEQLRSEINQINSRNETLNRHLADLHEDYSNRIKRKADSESAQDAFQEDVREIRERIASEEAQSRDLSAERARIGHEALETQRSLEEQVRLQGVGNRELAALSDFRSALSPSVLPVPLASHRLGLLAAAMIFSLLLAFGTIVALQKFQTNSYWRGDQSDSSPETETSSGDGTRDSLADVFNPLITSVPKRSMVIKAEMD